MATYTFITGRERTVTIRGTIAGAAYYNFGYLSKQYMKLPKVYITAFGISFEFMPFFQFVGGGIFSPVLAGEKVVITLPLGLGSSEGVYSQLYYPPAVYSSSIDGFWEVTATLQEMVGISFSGDQLPPWTSIRFYERFKPGSTILAQASCGRASTILSTTAPDGWWPQSGEQVMGYGIDAGAEIRLVNTDGQEWEGSVTVTYSLPVELSDPGYSRSQTTPDGNYYSSTVSSTQLVAYAKMNSGHSSSEAKCGTRAKLYGVKTGNVLLRVARMDEAYAEDIVAKVRTKSNYWQSVTIHNGEAVVGLNQRRYQVISGHGEDSHQVTLDEWAPVQAYLDSDSLVAIGEDSSATRLFGHGWLMNGIRLSHDTRKVLDTCDTLQSTEREWAVVKDCTISVSAGAIHVTPTGPEPTIRRTMLDPPAERWNCYSYLRTKVKAQQDNAQIKLVVGSKEWVKNTGVPADTWVELYWDLCAPTNQTQPYDLQTTIYPEPITQDGPYWGVTQTAEMRLVLQNTIWDIDEVSLDVYPWQNRPAPFNKPNHSVRILPSFGWWVDRNSQYSVRRLITGQSDGKQALEIEDAAIYKPTNAPIQRDIRWVVDEINTVSSGIKRWLGWQAVLLAPEPSTGATFLPLFNGFMNYERPATWLNGAGLIYSGSGWIYKAGRIEMGTEPVDIQAQALFDEIDYHPGLGDVFGFGSGSYSETTKIPFGTVLRGQAFGLVLHPASKERIDRGSVELQRLSDEQLGGSAGLSGWPGMFETGSPFAKGGTQYKLVGNGTQFELVQTSRTYYTRIPLRTVTTAQVTLDYDYFVQETPNGEQVVELFIQKEGSTQREVKLRFSGFGFASDPSYEVTGTLTFHHSDERLVAIGVMDCAQVFLLTYSASETKHRLYLMTIFGLTGEVALNLQLVAQATGSVGAVPIFLRHDAVIGTGSPAIVNSSGEWSGGIYRTQLVQRGAYTFEMPSGFTADPQRGRFFDPYSNTLCAVGTGTNNSVALWRVSSAAEADYSYKVVLLGVLSGFPSTVLRASAMVFRSRLYLCVSTDASSDNLLLYVYNFFPAPPVGSIGDLVFSSVIGTGGGDCVVRDGSLLLYVGKRDEKSSVYMLSSGETPYQIA